MDDVPILGGEAGRELVKEFLSLHGPPAYVPQGGGGRGVLRGWWHCAARSATSCW